MILNVTMKRLVKDLIKRKSRVSRSTFITLVANEYRRLTRVSLLNNPFKSIKRINFTPKSSLSSHSQAEELLRRFPRRGFASPRREIRFFFSSSFFFRQLQSQNFARGETGLTRNSPAATFSAAFEVSSGANLIT